MRVDFLICGAQKGGTTALSAYLWQHPEICMAEKKEVHCFDSENFFRSGQPDFSAYHSHFNRQPSHKLAGEATPIYMYWRDAPQRIWKYNADMKLIVVLRNPIERAYSHWNMERARGADSLSFWDAIHSEELRCRETLPYQHRIYSYIDRGFYLEQLRRLWFFFPKKQVLILRNEDLRKTPRDVMAMVAEFLGVTPIQPMEVLDVHSQPYLNEMSNREKEYLRSIFEYEIKGIGRTLGWDCSNWLTS